MSVKITLEFKGVDEAIVALGKLVGGKVAQAAAAPVLLAAPEAAKSTASTTEARSHTEAPKRTRKPRADAGKERGPYKTTGEPAASEPAGKADSVAVPSAAPATPTQPAAPERTATAPEPNAQTPAAAGPVSDEAVQKAVEKIFGAKGYDDTFALLSRFGVKRGKDLPQDQRASFIQRVDGVLAGEAI